ncbi:protein kinase [Phytophthora infestans T30-4]|uniref:Protein kinase n=1 Tax=Phytophthora infestans (strain T30-4) TaxID=403677 RepID=D0N1J0_PHYIT|nr:protein kinase [Phytophthora infestans T30-4]EEY68169.1 protein kinase [Phytophthora infestans T30-4]|eukprot:XP_002905328.1 protein kinase [Phytophthora infestans T30-4]
MRFADRLNALRAAALMTIVATRLANAAGQIDIMCSETPQEATLAINSNSASYKCSRGQEDHTNLDGGFFQVRIGVSKVTLDLQYSPITSLNFLALNGSPTLNYTDSLNFANWDKLTNLAFEGVEFAPATVNLSLPSAITEIHFINSKLSDLSLTNEAQSLTTIDLGTTSVENFPKILYERRWTSTMGNITVDLSGINKTTMTEEQFNNLKANLETLSTQDWAQNYQCTNQTSGSSKMTILECNSPSSSGSESPSLQSHNSTLGSGSSSSSGSSDVSVGDDSSSGISTGALVAIIVVVVVIVVILAVLILRMHSKRKATNANGHNNDATATLMSKGDAAAAEKGSFISNDEFLRNFRLPQSDVALVKSQGTGRLWMGEYNGNKVMVKRVESEVTDSYVTKALMAQSRTFATISHPNITSLVGVTWLAGTDFAVVTEYMDKGNLKTVLSNTDVDLDMTTKLEMCCDVALALAYLHETEQNLCAKQLSSHKVLVNKGLTCKLSLFECVPSSAKLGGPSSTTTYSYGMGEVAWLPPEIITRSSPMDARKNNIYAFGVLVSEIFTRVSPYQSLVEAMGNTMSDVELVQRVRRQDPLIPHENRQEFLATPPSVRRMVEQCLSYAPMSRPTAKELVQILHNAKEELATNSI